MIEVLLGGSFDPVHKGHIALAEYFVKLLVPDALRIIPAGDPWQKAPLLATPEQRIAMLEAAFERQPVPVKIDSQEIRRGGPSYTIDTLRAVRAELGPEASIAFVLGADQLEQLDSWREWEQLFGLAHLCAASRPGASVTALPAAVKAEFSRRAATAEQLRETPQGLTFVTDSLALDISSRQVRAALQRGEHPAASLPPRVLDYIEQHNLYGS